MSVDTKHEVESLEILKTIEIAAPIEVAWDAMLEEIGPETTMMDGTAMPLKLEAWPGGRWYRDLGNNAGHLWGHVQVIKPPTLLEICGPMMMSYPAQNHIQYRLTAEGKKTRLAFAHRGIGLILPDHRDGMPKGWTRWIENIRDRAEGKSRSRRAMRQQGIDRSTRFLGGSSDERYDN